MQIELVTKDDLIAFKEELFKELKDLINDDKENGKAWLRSKEVRKMLGGISNGTLQNLRINGKLNATKVEGIYFYKLTDIKALLNAGSE